MARRRKRGQKWGRWILAGLVIVGLAALGVSRSPHLRSRFSAQLSLMADRLDQLVAAIKKPAVPEEPPASVKPGPAPPVPEAPMEKPVSDQDKRKLEEVLEPKTPP